MTLLSTKIATINSVEMKLGQLSAREAKDEREAESLADSIASGTGEEE